jgi:hypothetical protein
MVLAERLGDWMRTGGRGLLRNRNGGDMGRLKTGSSNRNLPADDTVLEALAEQIRRWPRTDALVFSSLGGPPWRIRHSRRFCHAAGSWVTKRTAPVISRSTMTPG